MRSPLSSARSSRAWLLYAGVLMFVVLAALTARTLWRAWNQRAGQARSAAVFELVQQRMPSRPIEAPGAIAWLRDQFAQYTSQLPEGEASRFERLSSPADLAPAELLAVAQAMHDAMASNAPMPGGVVLRPLPEHAASRRHVSLLTSDGATVVITRRRALEDDTASNEFVARVAPAVTRGVARIEEALRRIARPVRLYAVAEDGTLVSRPWGSASEPSELTLRSEALQLATRPNLPSFAPEEFFFRFAEHEADMVRHSGFYVDLGGRGLVSTLTLPISGQGQSGVLALDLAHAVDWDRFAASIDAPVAATIVHTSAGAPETQKSAQQAGRKLGQRRAAASQFVRIDTPLPLAVPSDTP